MRVIPAKHLVLPATLIAALSIVRARADAEGMTFGSDLTPPANVGFDWDNSARPC